MRARKWIAEQFSWTQRWIWPPVGDSVRSFFRNMQWWNSGRPLMDQTQVNYDYTRQLYRNLGGDINLGAGFCRPIVDLVVEYCGLPRVTSDDDTRDTFLNECISDYWGPQLLEAWRDACRDSKAIIRFRQPLIGNPLVSDADRLHGRIETIPPEMIEIIYAPDDPEMIEKAIVTHYVNIDETPDTLPVNADTITQVAKPTVREHQIKEIITTESVRFFDITDNRELVAFGTPNRFGFVPVWEMFNEYDSSLGGGQSDLEPLIPFIQAFHNVLLQSLQAHKYHSTPKLKFKVSDMYTFIANNFSEAIDPDTKQIIPGSSVKWQGREVLFFQDTEDADFLEVKSVLGDSVSLLEFLIECICIAAETPKWAIMKIENVSDKNAEARPFEKKIERKRVAFAEGVQMLCKMALVATGQTPETVRIAWPPIRLDDLVNKGQAVQQLITGLDVAKQNHWIADETAVAILGSLYPEFRSPKVEIADAANNYEPPVAAPAPPSATQGQQPPKTTPNPSNGKTTPAAAKRAVLTTTTPSRS